MKKIILNLSEVCFAAIIFSGCGQSKPDAATAEQRPPASPATAATASPSQTSPATAAATTPATPKPQTAAPSTPATDSSATAPVATSSQTAAPTVNATSTSVAASAVSQLVATAKAQGDTVLTSIGSDLADKAKTLVQSAAGNNTLKSQLSTSLGSLASGNDSGGLTTIYQVAQSASLTPSQMQLAKEVGNLASAYVVQKNFASLDGAQSDVATIVNSLRQGQITPAIPALQKVAQNASLTPTQKQLIGSIADQYAPGISKAAGALSQGLQSIPGLGGK